MEPPVELHFTLGNQPPQTVHLQNGALGKLRLASSSSVEVSLGGEDSHTIQIQGTPMGRIGLITPTAGGGGGGDSFTWVVIDTCEHWASNPTRILPRGTIVVYSDRTVIEGRNYPGIKVSDGKAFLVDLPFVGDDQVRLVLSMLEDHIHNREVHITNEERAFWNNKLNCFVDQDELIFNRL